MKVAMRIISEGGKPVIAIYKLEKQVTQGVKANAKIVIVDMEDDESISEYNDVQFEIPRTKV